MATKTNMTRVHMQSTSHALAMPLLSAVRNDGIGMYGINTLKIHF
jgi:hypothetical protein